MSWFEDKRTKSDVDTLSSRKVLEINEDDLLAWVMLLNGENIMQVQQMTEVHKNTPLKKLPKLSEFLRKVWMTICFR